MYGSHFDLISFLLCCEIWEFFHALYVYPLLFQLHQSSHPSSEGGSRIDSVKLRQRLDAITSSLNNLGDTIGNAFEVNAYSVPSVLCPSIIEVSILLLLLIAHHLLAACLSSHSHLIRVCLCTAMSNPVRLSFDWVECLTGSNLNESILFRTFAHMTWVLHCFGRGLLGAIDFKQYVSWPNIDIEQWTSKLTQ